ncbi:hypothetical protein LOD99_3206 [Oopsacas minuta]|uniref:Angio-associated migratory cell protein n=1 Tax=Oopsacas minuta TaxID=111878 RepID=A0AAV7JXR0_9METZ|nr:hypothetical protein LOD99_3206 [Oopsacas minuta]
MDPEDPIQTDGADGFDGTEEYEVTKTIELGDLDELGPVSSDEEVVDGTGQEMETEDIIPKPKELTPCTVLFNQHKGSVFSVGLRVAGDLAVSGGEDDRGVVWRTSNGEVVMECGGHKDSVISCGFSYDGKYVYTADMEGKIIVLKIKTGEVVLDFETADIEWARWHSGAHVLLAGCADGMTWMWRIPSGQYKTFPGHGFSCTCSAIASADNKLCTGYKDGIVKIWDMKEGELLHQIKQGKGGHTEGVTSLDINLGANISVSGSEDGSCKIYSISTGKVVQSIQLSPENAVECVSISRASGLLACGTLNGTISVWDTRTQKIRHTFSTTAGIVSLQWCFPTAHNILCCTLDGSVNLCDSRSGDIVRTWSAHSDEVLAMDVLEDKGIFVTGSADNTARIFSI